MGVLARRLRALSRPLCAAEGVSPRWKKLLQNTAASFLQLKSCPEIKGSVGDGWFGKSYLLYVFAKGAGEPRAAAAPCRPVPRHAPSGSQQSDSYRSVGQSEGKRSRELRVHSCYAQARNSSSFTSHICTLEKTWLGMFNVSGSTIPTLAC